MKMIVFDPSMNGGTFQNTLGTMGMSEWVDGGASCALPVTPTMRVSHTVSEMREARRSTKKGREKAKEEEEEEVCANPASGRGSCADPYPQPRTLVWRERNKAGRGSWGSSDRTMAQTRSSQLRTVSDRSAPPPQPSPARIRQSRTRSGSR